MAAKIIVHKFEAGFDYKSLQITIEEDLSETKFGEWLSGRNIQKKKDNEKSSRLIVKIVSGSELNNFNLDACAQLINNVDSNYRVLMEENTVSGRTNLQHVTENYNNEHLISTTSNDMTMYNHINNLNTLLSPLEFSLERVRENNARIMENIHMLNRTLNYTKKNEMMDGHFPKSIRSFPCETCGKCFVYETGLKRHLIMRHSMMESPPRWQVVWTCIECFQVWPQHDIALNHSKYCCKTENMDSVREIKTSSILQCEFCEKVYSNIPRLLKHAKMHTTNNNYECNSCCLTFISYKMAEEHWIECQWLSTYYNFSLPKLLLCNSCDRKFRNYDQLYNHRYKIGHFMAKINGNHLSTTLYQCELCGESFGAISQLQMHKRQFNSCLDTISYNDVGNNV